MATRGWFNLPIVNNLPIVWCKNRFLTLSLFKSWQEDMQTHDCGWKFERTLSSQKDKRSVI